MQTRTERGQTASRPTLGAWLALPLLLATATLAQAQPPSLEGFWWPGRGGGAGRMTELTSRFPDDGVAMRDLGLPSRTGGDFGDLDVKPAALAEAMAWNPMDEETVSRVCKPPTIIYGMPGPFPFQIYQSDTLVVFRLEYYDQTRVVFLDGREHPGPDYPHTTVGHSIGHWEGDTLVIDTTHLVESTLMGNGLRHSDQVHLLERFRMTADGAYLHWTQVVEDPVVLGNRGVRYNVFEQRDGYVYPYDCDPAYGLSIQERGGQDSP